MTATRSLSKKRRSPFSLVLPQELESYLRACAEASYRPITKEIVMRLEESRARQVAVPQGSLESKSQSPSIHTSKSVE
jgi:hypothetical protein